MHELSWEWEPDRQLAAERNRFQSKRVIISKRSCRDIPRRVIEPMTTDVLAADTGPEGGIQCLSVKKKEHFDYFHGSWPISPEPIAGVPNWRKHHHRAFGLSQSLYDVDPDSNALCGEPNADAFAVVARENNAFLAVADGVNWGEKSFRAARSAVKGCIEYLSCHLHEACTTQEITETMLRSFKCAQECIINCDATLTTLCAAVICRLQDFNGYALCTVNVGDSLVFVYRKGNCVEEITVGSHDEDISRDMRNTGGCLGPSDGHNPDLGNLTFSFTFVEEGDIVFLTTDGISDNFDPVVLKKSKDDIQKLFHPLKTYKSDETIPSRPARSQTNDNVEQEKLRRVRSKSMPAEVKPRSGSTSECKLSNKSRQAYACKLMQQEIESESPSGEERSAKELCANLMKFVINSTRDKRQVLEDGTIERRKRYQDSKTKPGKLDHATVVAFEVGHFRPEPWKLTFQHNTNKDPKARRTIQKNLTAVSRSELQALLRCIK